ncbi:MAG: Coq4 family protein [Cyanobacteriota bacterium]|nr:Coq4 family protein [Cyanobacteriota bacterium]
MHTIQQPTETWQDNIIESIIDFVKAPEGDKSKYVSQLAKTTGEADAIQKIIEFISKNPQGKKAFQERLLLGYMDLNLLYGLPSNTLGYAYAKHMLDRGLKPLESETLTVDNDAQFLSIHLTETHDIWHVVTGTQSDIPGELQIEAFCVSQIYPSRFWLGLIVKNLLKSVIDDIELSTQYMNAITKGWLMGKQAKPLFGINWNQFWEHPLEEVRADLNIVFPDI